MTISCGIPRHGIFSSMPLVGKTSGKTSKLASQHVAVGHDFQENVLRIEYKRSKGNDEHARKIIEHT